MGILRKFSFVLLFIVSVLMLAACGTSKKYNIAIGPPASETNNVSRLILEAYGLKEGDYTAFQEAFGDAADGVKDGNIDISIGVLGLPTGSIESLHASTGDVRILGLSEEAIQYIEENSGYRKYIIPTGSYEFVTEDIPTVTAYAILMANTDTISEELGYQLAKIMVENSSEITHAMGAHMTLENALLGSEGLPIHPGAARYYQEMGLEFDNPIAEVNVTEQKSELILGTGSSGGTYYPLGGEMATVWNRHIPEINVTNTETGASIENLATIGSGNMDLGMTVHVPALQAVNGTGEFEGAQVTNAAFIGHIYPEVVQIVTREATGIKSLDDLKK